MLANNGAENSWLFRQIQVEDKGGNLKRWSKKLKISNDLTVWDIHSRNFQSQRQQHSGKLYIHIAVVISYSEEVKHIANS